MCDYKLAGEFKISQENKEKLNKDVLELLYKTGIRKTSSIQIVQDDVSQEVAEIPAPDENGIVEFNYSIFEKRKRETGSYDTKTCCLTVSDRGYNEYGLAMNLIMLLQESYSTGECFLMYKDGPCQTSGYLFIICSIMGKNYSLPGREKMWNMELLLYKQGYPIDNLKNLYHCYNIEYQAFYKKQLTAYYYSNDEGIVESEFKDITGKESRKEVFTMSNYRQRAYLALYMKPFYKNDPALLQKYIQKLLNSNLQVRKTMADEKNDFQIIAEISLEKLPPLIFSAYAYLCGKEFWELWDELQIKGYTDILNDEYCPAVTEEYPSLDFYKAIFREDEDEFLEFWDEREVKISACLSVILNVLKEKYENLSVPKHFDTLKELNLIVHELSVYWQGRLISGEFVREFMEHKDNPSYQKALVMIRELMDKDVELFAELPKYVAVSQFLRNREHGRYLKDIEALISLLSGNQHRKEIFGF